MRIRLLWAGIPLLLGLAFPVHASCPAKMIDGVLSYTYCRDNAAQASSESDGNIVPRRLRDDGDAARKDSDSRPSLQLFGRDAQGRRGQRIGGNVTLGFD